MLPKNFVQQFLQSGLLFTHGNSIIVGWGNLTKQTHPTNTAKPNFYFPDFFLKDPTPWMTPCDSVVMTIQELLQILTNNNNTHSEKLHISWNTSCKMSFKEEFSKLQNLISQKKLNKAVPYIFETSPTNMNPQMLQQCLISALQYSKNNHVYLYGFWENDSGMLGATPEILFHQNDLDLKTMACAGTAPANSDQEKFKNDPKEKYEHDVVIHDIKNAISSLGGEVQIDKTEILQLPNICHLMTHIHTRFQNHIPYENLVRTLHPTPALGATPREEGAKWLVNYNSLIPRQQFGAPIGFYLPQEKIGACYVAIRNVLWTQNQMRIGAGCGIVSSSVFEKEWSELELKIRSIKKILSL